MGHRIEWNGGKDGYSREATEWIFLLQRCSHGFDTARRSSSGERGLGRGSNAAKRGSNGVEQHASVSCTMALYAKAHPLTNEPWLKSHDSTDTPSRQVDIFQNSELRKGVGQENGGSDRTIKG